MTLSVPELATCVVMLEEKSLCLLIRPDDKERPRLPIDGVPGIDDEGVTSPLLIPLPPAPLSRKIALMKSPTSPPPPVVRLGVEGPPEPLPGVVCPT